MKNKLEDLRNHLFETLEALKDKDAPMDLDRAKAVVQVAQAITDTARVEVDFVKATGQASVSGFIPAKQIEPQPGAPRLVKGAAGLS